MKTIIYALLFLTLFSCKKEAAEPEVKLPTTIHVRFILELSIGKIQYAGICQPSDTIAKDVKEDITLKFLNVALGDTSQYIEVNYNKVRLYLKDSNNFKYYSSVYEVSDNCTLRVTQLQRYK